LSNGTTRAVNDGFAKRDFLRLNRAVQKLRPREPAGGQRFFRREPMVNALRLRRSCYREAGA